MRNDWIRKTLLIVHIPKAAGTTLRHIAELNYTPAEIFTIGNDIPAERKALALDPNRNNLRLVFGHMQAILIDGRSYRKAPRIAQRLHHTHNPF